MKRFWKILFPVLTFFMLLFILRNSLLPTETVHKTTSSIAGTIAEQIEGVTETPVKVKDNHRVIISKIGHLVEYASFSLFLTLSVFVLGGDRKEKKNSILLCTVVLALADEQLQFLNAGRGSRVSDILIDLAAGMIGFAVASAIAALWTRRMEK